MLTPVRRQRGVSLVELLIGMALGLALLAGAVSFFSTNMKVGADNLKLGHLAGELRSAMLYMTREIRRAGYTGMEPGYDYDGNGSVDADDLAWLSYNPFFDNHDLTLGRYDSAEANDSCLLFSYNLDAAAELTDSPPLPKVDVCSSCTPSSPYDSSPYDDDGMEIMGFRLRDGQLQRRKGGVSALDCTGDSWEAVTSDEIEITALQFTINTTELDVNDSTATSCSTGNPCIYERNVLISLAGRLAADSSIQLQLDDEIKVRNSYYVSSAP
jgi:type II secretory pathway component PulJ